MLLFFLAILDPTNSYISYERRSSFSYSYRYARFWLVQTDARLPIPKHTHIRTHLMETPPPSFWIAIAATVLLVFVYFKAKRTRKKTSEKGKKHR